jgi:hypothetical protein
VAFIRLPFITVCFQPCKHFSELLINGVPGCAALWLAPVIQKYFPPPLVLCPYSQPAIPLVTPDTFLWWATELWRAGCLVSSQQQSKVRWKAQLGQTTVESHYFTVAMSLKLHKHWVSKYGIMALQGSSELGSFEPLSMRFQQINT